jgi:hypothetical protein
MFSFVLIFPSIFQRNTTVSKYLNDCRAVLQTLYYQFIRRQNGAAALVVCSLTGMEWFSLFFVDAWRSSTRNILLGLDRSGKSSKSKAILSHLVLIEDVRGRCDGYVIIRGS